MYQKPPASPHDALSKKNLEGLWGGGGKTQDDKNKTEENKQDAKTHSKVNKTLQRGHRRLLRMGKPRRATSRAGRQKGNENNHQSSFVGGKWSGRAATQNRRGCDKKPVVWAGRQVRQNQRIELMNRRKQRSVLATPEKGNLASDAEGGVGRSTEENKETSRGNVPGRDGVGTVSWGVITRQCGGAGGTRKKKKRRALELITISYTRGTLASRSTGDPANKENRPWQKLIKSAI